MKVKNKHRPSRIFDEGGALNIIIETPKGNSNKYNYDEVKGLFRLGGVLLSARVFRLILVLSRTL